MPCSAGKNCQQNVTIKARAIVQFQGTSTQSNAEHHQPSQTSPNNQDITKAHLHKYTEGWLGVTFSQNYISFKTVTLLITFPQ